MDCVGLTQQSLVGRLVGQKQPHETATLLVGGEQCPAQNLSIFMDKHMDTQPFSQVERKEAAEKVWTFL